MGLVQARLYPVDRGRRGAPPPPPRAGIPPPALRSSSGRRRSARGRGGSPRLRRSLIYAYALMFAKDFELMPFTFWAQATFGLRPLLGSGHFWAQATSAKSTAGWLRSCRASPLPYAPGSRPRLGSSRLPAPLGPGSRGRGGPSPPPLPAPLVPSVGGVPAGGHGGRGLAQQRHAQQIYVGPSTRRSPAVAVAPSFTPRSPAAFRLHKDRRQAPALRP